MSQWNASTTWKVHSWASYKQDFWAAHQFLLLASPCQAWAVRSNPLYILHSDIHSPLHHALREGQSPLLPSFRIILTEPLHGMMEAISHIN